jgi:hypothetical protein
MRVLIYADAAAPTSAPRAGYESRPDAAASDAYSANIMEQTVRWAMLDQLRAPPAAFADHVRAHFHLRGAAALAAARGWAEWCRGKGHQRHANAIKAMLPALEAEIGKLGA